MHEQLDLGLFLLLQGMPLGISAQMIGSMLFSGGHLGFEHGFTFGGITYTSYVDPNVVRRLASSFSTSG